MYDFSFLRQSTDRLWSKLRQCLLSRGLSDAPDSLTRTGDYRDLLGREDLLLSQVCGHDFIAGPHAQNLTLLGTPHYSWPGCQGYRHRSLLVVRREETRDELAAFAGGTVALNYPSGNSGFNAFADAVAALNRKQPLLQQIQWTGSHAASLQAVSIGRADLACVDCISYALLQSQRGPAMAGLRILAETPSFPAPPFVCAGSLPRAQRDLLQGCLQTVLSAPGALPGDLGIAGFSATEAAAYQPVAAMAQKAAVTAIAVNS